MKYLVKAKIIILCLVILMPIIGWAEPSNYNSGISVLFGGTQGADWDEEIFWHNPVEDDHKVVYIKEDTLITMQHNERNMRQTFDTSRFVYDIGDEGLIRYRVDRDLQLEYYWAVMDKVYPEYTEPINFRSLRYATPDNTLVLGKTGGVGSNPNDRTDYYYAGQIDEFGDEWHTIAFADDDHWLVQGQPDIGPADRQHLASDGKSILFVVNPKTPLIKFVKQSQEAQFYTTPAKNYWIPKIHSQITYLTNSVDIQLVNIMGGTVHYKINNGDEQEYIGSISAALLNDGENSIEYWYDNAFHKTRRIIKNPDFPSRNEQHGYLLWKNDDELDRIKQRLQRGEDHGYKQWYDLLKGHNSYNKHTIVLGEGRRILEKAAIINAFTALIEGYDYTRQGDALSYAQYAKRMLLDNVRKIDPLWFGDATGTPNPCIEIDYRGYWDVDIIYSNIFAYDMLIKDYKSTQFSGGITPIEDHKIRDMLARFVLECMMELGNYGYYYDAGNVQGMWGTARCLGSLVVAVGMPTYNTHYYGTSGFDGSTAEHPYTPFPDYPITWKQAFFTEDTTLYGYPNQAHQYDDAHIFTSAGDYYVKCITEREANRGDMVIPAGSFSERISYIENLLMGHCYYITANVMKIKEDHTYPYWEMLFDYVNKGILYGLKVVSTDDALPKKYPQVMLVNERFPELAQAAEDNLHFDYDNTEDAFTVWRCLTSNTVYGLIFYNDEWRDYVGNYNGNDPGPDPQPQPDPDPESDPETNPDPDPELEEEADDDIPDKTMLTISNNIIKSGGNSEVTINCDVKDSGTLTVKIYDSKGKEIITLYDGHHDAGTFRKNWYGKNANGNEVGSGIYMVHMKSGNYSETRKIAVVK